MKKTLFIFLLLFISSKTIKSQEKDFKYDKEVVQISKSICNDKSITNWKHKSYYNTIQYLKKIRYNWGWNAGFFDAKMLERPNNNSMMITYLLKYIDHALFENKNANIDSLCKVQINKVTEKEALLCYYENIFNNVFNTGYLTNLNLSTVNFNIDSLGLKNDTEKMIVYISAATCLIRGMDLTDSNGKIVYSKVIELEKNSPTINKNMFLLFQLSPYDDFNYNSTSFKHKIEFFEFVKDKCYQTYDTN